MRSNEIHPGDLVAGKYRVRAILGRSHGILADGFHTEFEQRVIIKLLPAGFGDEKEIERFRREARTLAKLESEHVARIIDVGSQPDGSFYLVRQYLEGTDLAAHIRQRGALPLQEAVLYILQAAEAVAETHSHNIIIRELEPSHLFVTQRPGGSPLIKLIDFGTAKLMRDAAAPGAGELTATTMFGLSPYSSPELMRKAKNVDMRTDIWSLGAILYELLTGRPPFAGEPAALMLAISKDDPVPATHLRPDLPADIDAIIGWCLAKDVDGRFRNVHAFAHALTPFTRGEGEVLIQRIGQTTENARKRRAASTPPPAAAVAAVIPPPRIPPPRSSGPGNEDSSTRIMPHAGAQGGGDAGAGAGGSGWSSPSARTMPFPHGGPGQPEQQRPLPPPSQPGFAGPQGYGVPAPAGSQPGGFSPASAQPAQAGMPPGRGGDSLQAVAPPSTPKTGAEPMGRAQPSRNRNLMFGLMAAGAVLVPVLVLVLFLAGGKKESSGADAESTAPIVVPVPTSTAAAEPAPSAQPADTAAAQPPAEPPATAVAAATQAPEAPPTSSPVAAAGSKKTGSSSQGGSSSQSTPPPSGGSSGSSSGSSGSSSSSSSSSGGGGKGTLVAVAMGGSCSFSVNGSSKGTSSSIRVALAPGRYSVTCKPASGAAKSKSVVVKGGETAMATFRL